MAEQEQAPERLGTLQSLVQAVRSWRTLSVVLLSFSSGMPLGLVWIAIPDWMRAAGIDIRLGRPLHPGAGAVDRSTWSGPPLMDRFPLPFLGRRRGWAAVAQVCLLLGTLFLAGVGDHPDTPWLALALTLAIAMAAASQDIAVDAYAVDVLRKEEQGAAGRRPYRPLPDGHARCRAGPPSRVAGSTSWPLVCVGLAALYLPMLAITTLAPRAEEPAPPARRRSGTPSGNRFWASSPATERSEILAFVILFKFWRQPGPGPATALPCRHGLHRVPPRRSPGDRRHDRRRSSARSSVVWGRT